MALSGWGSELGKIAQHVGMGDLAPSVGSLYDLWDASNQRDAAMADQTKYRDQSLQLENVRTAEWLKKGANQKLLKDELLAKAAEMAQVTGEINKSMGVPFAPTRADVIKRTAELSHDYQQKIWDIALFNKSKQDAANIVSGFDSRTRSQGQNLAFADLYGKQLRDAQRDAGKDARAEATDDIELDKLSREQQTNYYKEGLPKYYDRLKGLYSADTGTMPQGESKLYQALAKEAGQGVTTSEGDMAKLLERTATRITKPYEGGPSAIQRLFGYDPEKEEKTASSWWGKKPGGEPTFKHAPRSGT
jgi:hypothetical protein